MSAPLATATSSWGNRSWLRALVGRLQAKDSQGSIASGTEVQSLRDELVAELSTHDPRLADPLNKVLDRVERGRIKPPLLPQVSLELLSLARDNNVSYDKLAKLAVTDPTVAARIMKVATSAAAGTPIPPQGVKDALVRLGLDGIRQVAFELAFSSKTLRRGPHVRLVERVVRHARTASALARLLARDTGVHAGTAALAGLVHALGGIVLIDQLSFPAGRRKRQGDVVLPGFLVFLCVTRLHPLVTAQVGRTFGLSDEILDAVEHHHALSSDGASGGGPTPSKLARLLLLADLISPGEPGARAVPVADALARSGLELDEQKVHDRLLPLTTTFCEMSQQGLSSSTMPRQESTSAKTVAQPARLAAG